MPTNSPPSGSIAVPKAPPTCYPIRKSPLPWMTTSHYTNLCPGCQAQSPIQGTQYTEMTHRAGSGHTRTKNMGPWRHERQPSGIDLARSMASARPKQAPSPRRSTVDVVCRRVRALNRPQGILVIVSGSWAIVPAPNWWSACEIGARAYNKCLSSRPCGGAD
jgi:hypothetical protein